MMKSIFATLLVAIALGAADANADVYTDALKSPSRLEADAARDDGRKPAEVLAFFGIGPDMVVLDMFSGGGYYAEIMSTVVGKDGRVVAHSNTAYLQYVGEEFKARHADDRLPNVDVLMAENNELALDANQFDAITMVLSFHDTYWINPEEGWPEFDRAKLHAELFASLKPGGVLGVVDHYAAAGSSSDTGGTVHRIDPAIAIADFEAAGFVLEAESDMLRNPEDDYSQGVFASGIRGKTDRFVLRFRKPE
jgi:predicted methyltransferase